MHRGRNSLIGYYADSVAGYAAQSLASGRLCVARFPAVGRGLAPNAQQAGGGASRPGVRAHGFRGRAAGVALPSDRVAFCHLRLARMPDCELRQALRWRIAREIGQSVESIVSDFHSYDRATGSGGQEAFDVLGVHASVDDVRFAQHAASLHGLRVHAIDTVPGSLARCLWQADGDSERQRLAVVLLCEPGRTSLLFCKGGEVCMIHAMPTIEIGGSDALTDGRAVVEASLPDHKIDEFVSEVRAGLHYILERIGDRCDECDGTVVAIGADNGGLLALLNQSTGIVFRRIEELVSPWTRALMAQIPFGFDLHASLIALGMAAHPGMEAARGAAA